jgi:hypothetical protein
MRQLLTGLAMTAAFLGPVMAYAAEPSADILQQIKTAKTPAEHEAIASYYEQQAAAAKKKAAEHEKMAETYKGGGTSIGKGVSVSMPQHCEALAKSFNEEAAQYAAMAQAHRDLAKSAK